MSARTTVSWQTSLADLSLILFMITTAAVTHRPPVRHRPEKPAVVQPQAGPSVRGEALAVYIAAPGAPPLAQWLIRQPRDPRQQLTITVGYAPGMEAPALEKAVAMLRAAQEVGPGYGNARIVVEPGAGPPRAEMAFDAPAPAVTLPSTQGVARSLQPSGQTPSHGPMSR